MDLPNPASARADAAEEAQELQIFRKMAKIARQTTAREIDRLFGPVE